MRAHDHFVTELMRSRLAFRKRTLHSGRNGSECVLGSIRRLPHTRPSQGAAQVLPVHGQNAPVSAPPLRRPGGWPEALHPEESSCLPAARVPASRGRNRNCKGVLRVPSLKSADDSCRRRCCTHRFGFAATDQGDLGIAHSNSCVAAARNATKGTSTACTAGSKRISVGRSGLARHNGRQPVPGLGQAAVSERVNQPRLREVTRRPWAVTEFGSGAVILAKTRTR